MKRNMPCYVETGRPFKPTSLMPGVLLGHVEKLRDSRFIENWVRIRTIRHFVDSTNFDGVFLAILWAYRISANASERRDT